MNKYKNLDNAFRNLNYNDLIFIKYTPIMAVMAEHLYSAYKSLNSNNFKSIKLKKYKKTNNISM